MDRAVFGTVYEKVFAHVKKLPRNAIGTLYVMNVDNRLIYSKTFGNLSLLSADVFERTAVGAALKNEDAVQMHGDEHGVSDLAYCSSYGIPLYDYSKLVAGLGLVVPQEYANEAFIDFLQTLSISITLGYQAFHTEVQNLRRNKGMSDEVHRRDKLFEIASKFHSTMNAEHVVYNIMDTISELYPNVKVDLYLSLDLETTNPNYEVKSLNMDGTDDLTLLAFRDGISKTSIRDNRSCIASPIRGNQGVYGVLRMEREDRFGFNKREQEYIQFITDTGGSAFENAQLYEQSRNLIQELRLINEMARQMNRSLKMHDVLEYILKQIREAFHSDYSLILSFDATKKVFRVISSCDDVYVGMEFNSDEGYLGKLYRSKESYIVSDTEHMEGNTCTDPLAVFPHRSLLLVPFLQNAEITGAIAVLDRRHGYFSYENLKFLHLIAQHTSLAITNASLHLEMERLIITDNLTGLNTRKHLNEIANESMKKHEQGSLIVLDIDHFKKVNDHYGHLVGDEILVQVAKVLQAMIENSGVAARWGGEEMAIYLPKVQHERALEIAEQIRIRVSEETNPNITVSIGVSTWKKGETDITMHRLFLEADRALYIAKNNGRNQVVSAVHAL